MLIFSILFMRRFSGNKLFYRYSIINIVLFYYYYYYYHHHLDDSDDDDDRPARKRRLAERAAEGVEGEDDEEVIRSASICYTLCNAYNFHQVQIKNFFLI